MDLELLQMQFIVKRGSQFKRFTMILPWISNYHLTSTEIHKSHKVKRKQCRKGLSVSHAASSRGCRSSNQKLNYLINIQEQQYRKIYSWRELSKEGPDLQLVKGTQSAISQTDKIMQRKPDQKSQKDHSKRLQYEKDDRKKQSRTVTPQPKRKKTPIKGSKRQILTRKI